MGTQSYGANHLVFDCQRCFFWEESESVCGHVNRTLDDILIQLCSWSELSVLRKWWVLDVVWQGPAPGSLPA